MGEDMGVGKHLGTGQLGGEQDAELAKQAEQLGTWDTDVARGQQLDKVMDVAERGQQQGEGMSVAKQLGAGQMGGKQDAQLDQQERRATGGQM